MYVRRLSTMLVTALFALPLASLHAEEILLSALLNTPAEAADDNRVDDDPVMGRVRDVLVDREGRIVSVLVEQDLLPGPQEDVASAARRGDMHEALHEFEIAGVRYDPQREVMELHGAGRNFGTQDIASLPVGQVRTTELLELPVSVVDRPNAGTVEDVVVDLDDERLAGIVVASGTLFTSTRIFPVDLDAYDRQERALHFALQESEMERLPEAAKQD